MKTSLQFLFFVLICMELLTRSAAAQTFTNLHIFAGGGSGSDSLGTMVLSGNTLYGTTYFSGNQSGAGTIFKINTDGSGFSTFSSAFTGVNSGANPQSGLILSGNTLYGTTENGGEWGYGTIFSINTDGGNFQTIYNFTNTGDGAYPFAGLVLSSNTLYGAAVAAANGDSFYESTIFAVNTDGTGFRVIHSFDGSDGSDPLFSLVLSGNTLYGTTAWDGTWGGGTVFKVNTDGTGFQTLYNFSALSSYGYNSDGQEPNGLILSGDTLYGTAREGGDLGNGTVFAVDINGGFRPVYSFTDGGYPEGQLAISGATLYGTTVDGGDTGWGSVFAVNTDGSNFTNIYSFEDRSTNGNSPVAGLTLSNNTLYGTTTDGGDNGNDGTVFSISIANFVPVATITVVAAPWGGGTVTGGGSFAVASQVQISATPSTACTFYGWNDGNTDNPRTITVPAGGATYVANFIPPANITFYHQIQSPNDWHGHCFLGITPPEGQTSYWGFYPVGANPEMCGLLGHVQSQPGQGWDYGISYPITIAQYKAATSLINYDLINPPDYCLISFNCTDWLAYIGNAAGVTLPPHTYAGVSAPSAFLDELVLLGVGNPDDNGNGVVIERDPPATNQIPYDYDYYGMESVGQTNPVALTASLGVAYDPVNLGAVNANDTNGLSLSINGADPSEDLISMNWGDGSAFQEQSLTFTHVYTNGTYSADLLIVDAGAVHSYSITVTVSPAPAASIPVNVTSFPPSNAPNPGLSDAGPIPAFSVVGTTSLSVLSNGQASISFLGVPGWSYTIWETTNLTQPFVPIGSATAGTNGVFQYEDTNAVNLNTSFYRASYP